MLKSKEEFTRELKERMLKIKPYLPKRYAETIVERLKEKGIDISVSTVYFSLNPKRRSVNVDVAEEVIILANENNRQLLLDKADKFLNAIK